MSGAKILRDGQKVALIGDEDTVTGFLLAGVGEKKGTKRTTNYLIVDKDTERSVIEETFKDYTARNDVAVVLINQHVAEEIRHLMDGYNKPIPAVLEIPSKNHPYDPSKDSVLKRAQVGILQQHSSGLYAIIRNG
eukprot:Clim_evm9s251 gene=Clim_evmTU9s251